MFLFSAFPKAYIYMCIQSLTTKIELSQNRVPKSIAARNMNSGMERNAMLRSLIGGILWPSENWKCVRLDITKLLCPKSKQAMLWSGFFGFLWKKKNQTMPESECSD